MLDKAFESLEALEHHGPGVTEKEGGGQGSQILDPETSAFVLENQRYSIKITHTNVRKDIQSQKEPSLL